MKPFLDDPDWYPADWTPSAGDGDESLTGGLELELLGGPLAGRSALLRDSDFALWVAWHGRRWIVRASRTEPAPTAGVLAGAYVFNHGLEAMTWSERSPAPNDRAVA